MSRIYYLLPLTGKGCAIIDPPFRMFAEYRQHRLFWNDSVGVKKEK
ncbi:MAG: hypothetical protein LBQ50_14665 [Planctomycetaceae bacterium]|jgi:hypothetical protein|nr:hypothetical protein [Planctomycetaceae bacterium]